MFSFFPQIRHIQKQASSLGRYTSVFSNQIKNYMKKQVTLQRGPAEASRNQ